MIFFPSHGRCEGHFMHLAAATEILDNVSVVPEPAMPGLVRRGAVGLVARAATVLGYSV